MKETDARFEDSKTGATIQIFPSVLNELRMQEGDWSGLKFYIAPLCALQWPIQKLPTQASPDETIYRADLVFFHGDIQPQVEEWLVDSLHSKSHGKFGQAEAAATVSFMTHQGLELHFPDQEYVSVTSMGEPFEDLVLPKESSLVLRIPNAHVADFDALIEGKAVRASVRMYYESKHIKRIAKAWHHEDFVNTQTFKDLETGGGAFVTAEQVMQMAQDVAVKESLIDYGDPGLDSELAKMADEMFTRLLDRSMTQVATEVEDLRVMQAAYVQGTGADFKDFQPLMTMWELAEQVRSVDDYKEANEALKSYYDAKSKSWQIEAEVGLPFASVTTGYETSSESIKSGMFANENELAKFKETMLDAQGQEPRITARGLDLLDRATFVAQKRFVAKAIVIRPFSLANSRQIACYKTESYEAGKQYDRIFRRLQALERWTLLPSARPESAEGRTYSEGAGSKDARVSARD